MQRRRAARRKQMLIGKRTLNLGVLVAALVLSGVAAVGCGGSNPAAPTTAGAGGSSSNAVTVLSCSTIRYRGGTLNVGCSVPGQTLQPSGLSITFPGRSDCIRVTCSNGCATSAAAGTLVGGICQ